MQRRDARLPSPLCPDVLPGLRRLTSSPRAAIFQSAKRLWFIAVLAGPAMCQGARAGAALLTGTEGRARHQNTTLVLKSWMCVMGERSLRASYQSCVSLEAAEGGMVPKIKP